MATLTRTAEKNLIYQKKQQQQQQQQDSALFLFFSSKSPGGHAIYRQNARVLEM